MFRCHRRGRRQRQSRPDRERVSVDPRISCGHCYPCSVGKPNVRTSPRCWACIVTAVSSEYAVAPARNAHRIPDNIAEIIMPSWLELLPLRQM
ncbi:alcohol dehydrogenase catalytic domain-containing protein [Salmonella enterica subsp. enterica]|nr:alcohol dehydrogenase catalytic domain-containing protein [Salmonella enterica subsp. enterica]